MTAIVLDPNLPMVDRDDFLARRPSLEIHETKPSRLLEVLAESGSVSFVTTNSAWDDAYLSGLSADDWVTTIGAGYDRFPLDSFAERNVSFTYSPGINAPQVAEHAFAMAFTFSRNMWTYREQQRSRVWRKQRSHLTDLADDICCIVGLGSLGEAIAIRARAHGMTVRGVKRNIHDYSGAAHELYSSDSLCDALSEAQLVVLTVPLTDETRGIIGPSELAATDRSAIVVNVARGPVLQTHALVTALEEGTLAAACLDVTDPEPLPEDSPLWDRDDVLITPHCGGISDKYPERFLDEYLEQYDRWSRGEPLHHQPG